MKADVLHFIWIKIA
ncbi:hypothetical protein YPPY89_3921, partial [Yersinia pestis PY-89]